MEMPIIITTTLHYCRRLQSDVVGDVGTVVGTECLRSGARRMRADMRSVLLLSTPTSTRPAQTTFLPTTRSVRRRRRLRRTVRMRLLPLHFPLVRV